MRLNVTSNVVQVRRWLQSRTVGSRDTRRAIGRTAEFVKDTIKQRTISGSGVFGKFKSYSAEYAKFRRDTGRGAKVDLTYAGRMLAGMRWKHNGRGKAILFFRASEEEKAQQNHASRPFFKVNRKEEARAVRLFGRYLLNER